MPATPNLARLLLAAIDGQNTDLSAFTNHEINDGLATLVEQGYAYGKPIRRLGIQPTITVRLVSNSPPWANASSNRLAQRRQLIHFGLT